MTDPITPDASAKRFATLRAELALKGFVLVDLGPDADRMRFVIGRWGRTTEAANLDRVEQVLLQITGASHARG